MTTIVDVPQFYPQTDSRTSHADRMCFSSTVAMAIKFLKPEALSGSNADDEYLRNVLRYGDTTNPQAHLRALEDYGLAAKFSTTGTYEDLLKIVKSGRPVPVGWLHHGTVAQPMGGHWTLFLGERGAYTVHHDPYGEADMVNGGYARVGPFGKNIQYTKKRWIPRWSFGGEAWYLDVYDPSPKPVAPPPKPVVKLCPTCGQPLPSEDGGYDGHKLIRTQQEEA